MTEHSTEPIPRPCGPPPPVKAHGYSIVKNGKNGLKYKFRCAKARKYKDQRSSEIHESKRRKSSTQMTGCKFRLTAKPLPDGKWLLEVPEGEFSGHNNVN
ncbi:predicted protein [Chaetomium globosum CBS 148.51]|uniref:FAR1 domain-containing protein n=1 Tax=Chaetomium globosum (strain ATCC 6205 / CBS 148.51 / DSM 1962 / NBRC 6347 / NRRL 1970) TaxID=306901 RepID=Q2H519_CHAGB|nr:uncharacterized protein CHGG_06246 [Chaetomium globosum CBS 148.51]EAQ89627.1 predicted protein [Chaetomium globosum CBS 148.51]